MSFVVDDRQVSIELTSSSVTVGGYRARSRRLWVAVEFPRRQGGLLLRDCLLDTGAPLCVVPYSIHRAQDIDWRCMSIGSVTGPARWYEIPCDIGRVEVWLPTKKGMALGPFSLVAKFPRATPTTLKHSKTPVPVLLGLNFLADTMADIRFQCHTAPKAGTLEFP